MPIANLQIQKYEDFITKKLQPALLRELQLRDDLYENIAEQ
jgi:hypothetical protein